MKSQDIAEIAIVVLVLCGLAPFLGAYMARVFTGRKHPLSFLEPLERFIYRVSGIRTEKGMDWKGYALSIAGFSAASIILLDLILMLQGFLPLNPRHYAGVKWDLALNTAISFATNTNWQAYAGEASLSSFSQAVGLTVQNFVSAAAPRPLRAVA
jgi:K+-transporting ATPase ATPase A chain